MLMMEDVILRLCGMVVGNLKVEENESVVKSVFFSFSFFFSRMSSAVGQPVKRVHAQLEAKMH